MIVKDAHHIKVDIAIKRHDKVFKILSIKSFFQYYYIFKKSIFHKIKSKYIMTKGKEKWVTACPQVDTYYKLHKQRSHSCTTFIFLSLAPLTLNLFPYLPVYVYLMNVCMYLSLSLSLFNYVYLYLCLSLSQTYPLSLINLVSLYSHIVTLHLFPR